MKKLLHVYSFVKYPYLKDDDIRITAGRLIHNRYIDEPLPPELFADLVYETQVKINELPKTKIFRFIPSKYADQFLSSGTLRLGSFIRYRKIENPQRRDEKEGGFLLVGRNSTHTLFLDCVSGLNYYVLCCFLGETNDSCTTPTDDACIEVYDPIGFCDAIKKSLQATYYSYASCVYSKDKVILGTLPENYDSSTISYDLLNMVNRTKYFIKPDNFAHESEFRFIWEMECDVDDHIDIQCSETLKYCRRVY